VTNDVAASTDRAQRWIGTIRGADAENERLRRECRAGTERYRAALAKAGHINNGAKK
jgi:hypothetical protein